MTDAAIDAGHEEPHCVLSAKEFSSGVLPIWCPGCGDFGVLAALERGLAKHGRPPYEVVLVSGIGCSSRLPGYMSTYGFHGVHGRALAVAAGLKLTRPDLEVIVVGGDGDGYSLGGNHFIHACRRNVDMLYVVMDNRVYGMTKGVAHHQPDWDSDIAPAASAAVQPLAVAIDRHNYVARGFSGDRTGCRFDHRRIKWPGFAFIEVWESPSRFGEQRVEKLCAFDHIGRADRAAATALVLGDDGYSLGVLYRGDRAPVAPAIAGNFGRRYRAEFAVSA
jgi:2-oxoglutarate ferredoxin oxidoreductase subunit beta